MKPIAKRNQCLLNVWAATSSLLDGASLGTGSAAAWAFFHLVRGSADFSDRRIEAVHGPPWRFLPWVWFEGVRGSLGCCFGSVGQIGVLLGLLLRGHHASVRGAGGQRM